ncbi:hypothetical protein AGR7C_Lc100134 [Agrobacterium deltaense Zutra 3/1]|uniref:Uncharacterized protein n=1 Tax=Agrobacterium deltaense Zutra 3/1 TaxID=1183427 RepID=A0A1S7QSZ1_9HYPH|nr:hypothetical protein AGR7C_Lc100134 [Agrobacterium deltaense Zutra 3/1]
MHPVIHDRVGKAILCDLLDEIGDEHFDRHAPLGRERSEHLPDFAVQADPGDILLAYPVTRIAFCGHGSGFGCHRNQGGDVVEGNSYLFCNLPVRETVFTKATDSGRTRRIAEAGFGGATVCGHAAPPFEE